MNFGDNFVLLLGVVPLVFVALAIYAVYMLNRGQAFSESYFRVDKFFNNKKINFVKVMAGFILSITILVFTYYVYNITRPMEQSFRFYPESNFKTFSIDYTNDPDGFYELVSNEIYIEELDHTLPPLANFLETEVIISEVPTTLRAALQHKNTKGIRLTIYKEVSEKIAHTGKFAWENQKVERVVISIGTTLINADDPIPWQFPDLIIEEFERQYNQDINLDEVKRGLIPKFRIKNK